MADLIIYALLAIAFIWVGWNDRNQPFDRSDAVPIAQEEGTNGQHD